MVRRTPRPLSLTVTALRVDARRIAEAGVAAASARRLVARALSTESLRQRLHGGPLTVVAAGKASCAMVAAVTEALGHVPRAALAVGTHLSGPLDARVEWREAGHPLPDARSVAAAARALDLARAVPAGGILLVLLSGGASALLALPAEGVTLDEKQRVVGALLRGGADIHALNAVRKHLSAIKGGRLAAACPGTAVTLAISDVVGDDLSVIGSGPGVADPSTWADARDALERWTASGEVPPAVRAAVQAGLEGRRPESPKPGDRGLARAEGHLIGSARDAREGAAREARRLGYTVIVRDAPVTGEARRTAPAWLDEALASAGRAARVCVISSGETTVQVRGGGRGGRNQEFGLALVPLLAALPGLAVAASVGTDGIDGVTDAAGALVDSTSLARAAARGLAPPDRALDDNDAYPWLSALGDVVRTGPTDTNVGDLQILVRAPGSPKVV
ncbi:MAG: DUF4147 domain-containing protein [Acidobacteriota bacterium]